MRTLSLILFCLIIAVAACASNKQSRHERSNGKPTASQSNSTSHSSASAPTSAPATSARDKSGYRPSSASRQEATPRGNSSQPAGYSRNGNNQSSSRSPIVPGAGYRTPGRPVNYQIPNAAPVINPVTVSRVPRDTPSQPTGYSRNEGNRSSNHSSGSQGNEYRPNPAPDVSRTPRVTPSQPAGYSKNNSNRGSNRSPIAQGNEYRPNPAPDRVSRTPRDTPSQPVGYSRTGNDRGSNHASGSQGSSYRKGDSPTTHSIGRSSQGDDGHKPDYRTRSNGYNPRGVAYTVGYHPGKRYVPTGYKPPSFRQDHYYYSGPQARRPLSFGFWAWDYDPGFSRRSFYFNFGLYPYVQVARLSSRSYISISYVSEPLYIYGSEPYHNSRYDRLDDALADIRSAWAGGRFDLLQQHVDTGGTVDVLVDGQYDYSVSSNDYLSMTQDALGDLDTVSFVWSTVRERRDGSVTAFGKHSYRTSEATRTVYVSYTLEKSGQDYFITEVGSSLDPLE